MIKTFLNTNLEDFYYDGTRKKIHIQHVEKLERILERLDKAEDVLRDMNYPGSHLHKLEPRKDERWAVRVNKNYRVTFRFVERDAYEVDYNDYH